MVAWQYHAEALGFGRKGHTAYLEALLSSYLRPQLTGPTDWGHLNGNMGSASESGGHHLIKPQIKAGRHSVCCCRWHIIPAVVWLCLTFMDAAMLSSLPSHPRGQSLVSIFKAFAMRGEIHQCGDRGGHLCRTVTMAALSPMASCLRFSNYMHDRFLPPITANPKGHTVKLSINGTRK